MNIKDLKVGFEHTTAELELILAGLRKLPMEMVQELHDRIIHTANAAVKASYLLRKAKQMTTPNIYLPYPTPQSVEELQADMNALVLQPAVPQELQDQYTNLINSPTFQADVNEAEANSDSMDNE